MPWSSATRNAYLDRAMTPTNNMMIISHLFSLNGQTITRKGIPFSRWSVPGKRLTAARWPLLKNSPTACTFRKILHPQSRTNDLKLLEMQVFQNGTHQVLLSKVGIEEGRTKSCKHVTLLLRRKTEKRLCWFKCTYINCMICGPFRICCSWCSCLASTYFADRRAVTVAGMSDYFMNITKEYVWMSILKSLTQLLKHL